MTTAERKKELKNQLKANETVIEHIKQLVKDGVVDSKEPGFNPFFCQILLRSFQLELEIARL